MSSFHNIYASKAIFFFSRAHFNTNATHLKYEGTFTQPRGIFYFPYWGISGRRWGQQQLLLLCISSLYALDECSAHSSSAGRPYPRSSVKRPCWTWLLGAFQTGFVPSPPSQWPLPHLPPAHRRTLWLCVLKCVPAFKCTVSISTFSQGGHSFPFFSLVMWLAAFLLSFSQSLMWPWAQRGPVQSGHLWLCGF